MASASICIESFESDESGDKKRKTAGSTMAKRDRHYCRIIDSHLLLPPTLLENKYFLLHSLEKCRNFQEDNIAVNLKAMNF
jgi:hypothetical protein